MDTTSAAGNAPRAVVRPSTGNDVPADGGSVPPSMPARPEAPPPADLSRAVEALNQFLRESQRSLLFQVDEASGRTIITVVDPNSGEIVRQIPPEETLAMARSVSVGILKLMNAVA
jgi:flagellar protein FlaG